MQATTESPFMPARHLLAKDVNRRSTLKKYNIEQLEENTKNVVFVIDRNFLLNIFPNN